VREKISIIIVLVLSVGLTAALATTCYQRSKLQGQYRRTYEGRVIDKYVNYRESELGTFTTKHIIVRNDAGEEFPVKVSDELYERAQIGNWIRRKETGIELSLDGTNWK